MGDIGKKILEGLEDFAKKLENGDPIEITQVERVETPDGPMHLRRKTTLRGNDGISDDEDVHR